jgi:hypothetical protein
VSATAPLDPYFVLMPLPGEKAQEEFVMILPFTPSRRRNMIGWMAGRSDGAAYASSMQALAAANGDAKAVTMYLATLRAPKAEEAAPATAKPAS